MQIDRSKRTATFTVKAPTGAQPADLAGIEAAGAAWYPLQMARELDDAILSMRTNELDIGTWLIKTEGDAAAVLAMDATLLAPQATTGWCARPSGCCAAPSAAWTCRSRSLFALIEPGSCFAGTLLELALACDRSYHWCCPTTPRSAPQDHRRRRQLRPLPDGHRPEPAAAPLLRRGSRRWRPCAPQAGQALDADAALALGLVTCDPDDIDWADEMRIAIEERVAMSPDALTGMEANLRFNGPENMFTRVFGRLTAWQNWIFQRPNAVGEKGALKVYGKGDKAAFDWNRV